MTKNEMMQLMKALSKARALKNELERYYHDYKQLSIKSYAEDAAELVKELEKLR